MDWLGIIFFILVMVFKALGESEKQKKARQDRQRRPVSVPPPTAAEPQPPREAMPPVAVPDLGLPPIFSFPLFEETETKAEEVIIEEPRPRKELPREKPVYRETPALKIPARENGMPDRERLPGLQLHKAMEGMIWSEILQPPRAMRPPGAPLVRGRGMR
ncbi:MAG: hypothetical protein GX750_04010 [Clostridia bacterium]|nr:hypothetical protein [Clostridia bacterium]